MNYRWAKFENAMKEMYEERILGGETHTKTFSTNKSKQKLFCSAKLSG